MSTGQAPFRQRTCQTDGSARTYGLGAREAKDYYPAAAVEVRCKDADPGFEWNLYTAQSLDGGASWEPAVKVLGPESGDKVAEVGWPKCGLVRVLFEVGDANETGSVGAAVSVTVRA